MRVSWHAQPSSHIKIFYILAKIKYYLSEKAICTIYTILGVNINVKPTERAIIDACLKRSSIKECTESCHRKYSDEEQAVCNS